jgi:hypothetical protein
LGTVVDHFADAGDDLLGEKLARCFARAAAT